MADLLNDIEFEKFRKLIYDESGIAFSATNRSILDSRLKERLREKKLDSVDAYYSMVVGDKEEMKVMLDSVTTNLTRFFRNQPHFDAFVNYVIPHVIEEKKQRGETKIRLWSAGCSTGEEPYTIAMILCDILKPPYSFEILASDLSLRSLIVAKKGFYPETRIAGIPDNYLARFFDKKEGGYQAKQQLISNIKFDYHNLRHDSGLHNLDIVFCRNVMIYFDEPAQTIVVNRFWDSMASHSYLFIGHSESLFGMDTQFSFLKTQWACLYEKKPK